MFLPLLFFRTGKHVDLATLYYEWKVNALFNLFYFVWKYKEKKAFTVKVIINGDTVYMDAYLYSYIFILSVVEKLFSGDKRPLHSKLTVTSSSKRVVEWKTSHAGKLVFELIYLFLIC